MTFHGGFVSSGIQLAHKVEEQVINVKACEKQNIVSNIYIIFFLRVL